MCNVNDELIKEISKEDEEILNSLKMTDEEIADANAFWNEIQNN